MFFLLVITFDFESFSCPLHPPFLSFLPFFFSALAVDDVCWTNVVSGYVLLRPILLRPIST